MSCFQDELFLLQASTLQETLYNDIVLKVDQATEEVEADLAIVTDTRKKGVLYCPFPPPFVSFITCMR